MAELSSQTEKEQEQMQKAAPEKLGNEYAMHVVLTVEIHGNLAATGFQFVSHGNNPDTVILLGSIEIPISRACQKPMAESSLTEQQQARCKKMLLKSAETNMKRTSPSLRRSMEISLRSDINLYPMETLPTL